jgi:hypothetical protein
MSSERDGDDQPSLARAIRDAKERGEAEADLVDRVRASYDREVPRRRVERLVKVERERLEDTDGGTVLEGHAPRYVDHADLASLTDEEFGRVIARLLGEREGHAEVIPDRKHGVILGSEDPGTESRGNEADVTAGNTDDGGLDGFERGEGADIRWHRAEGTVFVRALAAEPSRVVDGEVVGRARERTRAEREERTAPSTVASDDNGDGGGTNGANDRGTIDTAVVTVAPVAPGAARLAVRSGVVIHDRTTVDRWLDGVRLSVETFGSLIETE